MITRNPLNPKIDPTSRNAMSRLILDLNLQLDNLVGAVNRLLPFESDLQTITSAGTLTIPHTLAALPRRYFVSLVCVTPELNYSAGDEVAVDNQLSITADSYNISVRYNSAASAFSIYDKTTGALTGITNANWQMRLRAWI